MNQELKDKLDKFYEHGVKVDVTMYQPDKIQCDDTPDITADQTKIPNIDSCSHLNWIAVSQDLLWFNDGPIRYGDTVYVEGYNDAFNVTIYENSQLRYIPIL